MTKIFRKLENQKYDSMNSHTLILTGWVGDTQKGRGTFVLTGDGKEHACVVISPKANSTVRKAHYLWPIPQKSEQIR